MGQQARVVDSTSPAPLLLPPALDPLPPLLPAAELGQRYNIFQSERKIQDKMIKRSTPRDMSLSIF
uniref:Uncharacterized protein n=1 Tax=Oryza sativa subsp. japonica TaxID=39947 RepID=Q6YS38_ORYSJ|nr:hypothetical protein [Oryza sativa Japonica Group]BAD31987.1 hypothetical protein [Oryza sativa Japonica Group]